MELMPWFKTVCFSKDDILDTQTLSTETEIERDYNVLGKKRFKFDDIRELGNTESSND